MDRKKIVMNLAGIGKDILIAFVVVAVIMLALWAYCGIWPPMVVVESGSMSRFDDRSVVGIIDTGDMVFVKTGGAADDITTYVEGEATNYSKYGSYGDVIIYRPNGLTHRGDGSEVVPIIHRVVVWLDVNTSRVNPNFGGVDYQNYSFDVPSLGLYGTTDNIVLENYGYWKEEVIIDLSKETGLLRYYEYLDMEPHGGYITMGDHNAPAYDQPLSGAYEPVLPEWIVGKAWGEIPWFGLVKLWVTGGNPAGAPGNSWRNLFVTVFLLLFIPFLWDITLPRLKKWLQERKKGHTESSQDAGQAIPNGAPKPEESVAEPPGPPAQDGSISPKQ